METHISQSINALMASQDQKPIGPRLPNAKWNAMHLQLNTSRHPVLLELERETGKFCLGMWDSPQAGRLLVLAGNNGTGKTHCAKAVRRWVNKVGHGKQWVPKPDVIAHLYCIFWSWPELLDSLKEGQWELVEDCIEAPCLIIDELGGGHDPSQVGVDKLCQILSKREKKWTLITTNIVPQAWEEKFDRRIASRFFRNSTLVDLTNVPDYNL